VTVDPDDAHLLGDEQKVDEDNVGIALCVIYERALINH